MRRPRDDRSRLTRRRARLAIVSAAAVAALVLAPSAALATFSGQNGRIAFSSVRADPRGALPDIYTADPDGRDMRRLTVARGFGSLQPVWNSTGTQIAFVRDGGTLPGIYVMDADGRNERRITTDSADQFPTWLPNGRQVAFWRGESFNRLTNRLFFVSVDGGTPRELTSGPADSTPSWHPSQGSLVAFTRRQALAIFDANADAVTPLTTPPDNATDTRPNWSPSGDRIFFTRVVQGSGPATFSIWVVNADGTGAERLVAGDGSVGYNDACPSPDGTQLGYRAFTDSTSRLFTRPLAGGSLTLVTQDGFNCSWQAVRGSGRAPNADADLLTGRAPVTAKGILREPSRVTLRVRCTSAIDADCTGRLTLTLRLRGRSVTAGSATFALDHRENVTLTVRLTAAGRSALRRGARTGRGTVRTRQPEGGTRVTDTDPLRLVVGGSFTGAG